MNKKSNVPMTFIRHHPEKFQYYTTMKNGFCLDYQPFLYRFDDDGGWADINGCYYDCNGIPAGWVFVQNNTYERYNMDHQFIESKQNLFYPVTILEQEQQKEDLQNYQVQKSFQKSSDSNQDEDLRYQKKKEEYPQRGSNVIAEQTLRDNQQTFKKYGEQNGATYCHPEKDEKLNQQYRPQYRGYDGNTERKDNQRNYEKNFQNPYNNYRRNDQTQNGYKQFYDRNNGTDVRGNDQSYRGHQQMNSRNNDSGNERQYRNNDREYNNDQNYRFQDNNVRNNNNRDYGDRPFKYNYYNDRFGDNEKRNSDYHQRPQQRQYDHTYQRNDDNRQQRNDFKYQNQYNPFTNQESSNTNPPQSNQYYDNHKEFDYNKREDTRGIGNRDQPRQYGQRGGYRNFNTDRKDFENGYKNNYAYGRQQDRNNNYRNYNDRPNYNRNDNYQNSSNQYNENRIENGLQSQKQTFSYVLSKEENTKKQEVNKPTLEDVAQVFNGVNEPSGRERKSRLNDSSEEAEQIKKGQ